MDRHYKQGWKPMWAGGGRVGIWGSSLWVTLLDSTACNKEDSPQGDALSGTGRR